MVRGLSCCRLRLKRTHAVNRNATAEPAWEFLFEQFDLMLMAIESSVCETNPTVQPFSRGNLEKEHRYQLLDSIDSTL